MHVLLHFPQAHAVDTAEKSLNRYIADCGYEQRTAIRIQISVTIFPVNIKNFTGLPFDTGVTIPEKKRDIRLLPD